MRNIATITAAAALALAADTSPRIDIADAGPGEATIRTTHKPSGSQPVPGGSARERARRLARMAKE